MEIRKEERSSFPSPLLEWHEEIIPV